MALSVETKALATVSPSNIPERRPVVQPGAAPAPATTALQSREAAQAFLESLPKDVRDRLEAEKRNPRSAQRQGDAFETQSATERPRPSGESVDPTAKSVRPSGPGFIASPSLSPQAALIQLQLAGEQTDPGQTRSGTASGNQAYLNAGAQAGGPDAVRTFREARQSAQNVLIVPPIPTSYNLQA